MGKNGGGKKKCLRRIWLLHAAWTVISAQRALIENDPCQGCNGPDDHKPDFCAKYCEIILCWKRIDNGYQYCDEYGPGISSLSTLTVRVMERLMRTQSWLPRKPGLR